MFYFTEKTIRSLHCDSFSREIMHTVISTLHIFVIYWPRYAVVHAEYRKKTENFYGKPYSIEPKIL